MIARAYGDGSAELAARRRRAPPIEQELRLVEQLSELIVERASASAGTMPPGLS